MTTERQKTDLTTTLMMKRSLLAWLTALAMSQTSAQVPQLDRHHLLLDAEAGQDSKREFVFTTFQEAASHLDDSCTLYIRCLLG